MSKLSVAEDADAGRDPEIERRLRAEKLDEHAPRLSWFADEALAEMELRASGTVRPIATPWQALNERLGGGFWPGLHVLTGTTGSGKTQLALQVALHAARAGVPALYIALELNRAELLARVLSLASTDLPGRGGRAIPWSDLYLGRNREALRTVKAEVLEAIRAVPLRIEEAPAGEWTASHLSSRATAMREHYRRTPLVVVDYLQIVGPEANDRDLRACIRSAAMRARNVAREGAAVLLLSSVSRENAKLLAGKERIGPDADPSCLVGLGKESGEIEFSADSVLALVRDEFQGGATPMHLAAAKVRAGRPGWVSLSFDGATFSGGDPVQGEA